ncbi:MAG: hypothetical protein ACJAUH_002069 [Saprospiraceae bacterium]|jgi:uncharacterized protein (TIGR02145 family)
MSISKQFIFKSILFTFLVFIISISCNSNKEITNNNHFEETNFDGDSGTFIDKRDGNEYKWIRKGSQIWMVENLRFKADEGCYAYRNMRMSVRKMGYLYDWHTAQTVAPEGWHLPSEDEYYDLIHYVVGYDTLDGYNMQSIYYAFEADTSGLNLFSTASHYPNNERYIYRYRRPIVFFKQTEFWTSSTSILSYNKATVYRCFEHGPFGSTAVAFSEDSTQAIPIRCVKD